MPTFCPTLQYGTNTSYYQFGSCCTDREEDEIKNVFNTAGKLSSECGEMYKQVRCTVLSFFGCPSRCTVAGGC